MSTPKGLKMLALTLVLLTVIEECFAVTCGTWPFSKICSDKCCILDSDQCCTYSFTSTVTSIKIWSIGTIVGVAIGSIVGLIILIVIIVAIVKACTKTSGAHGRVVQPYYNPAAGVILTTGTQSEHSGPAAMYPQPPMYPPPPTADSGPTQGAAPPPALS